MQKEIENLRRQVETSQTTQSEFQQSPFAPTSNGVEDLNSSAFLEPINPDIPIIPDPMIQQADEAVYMTPPTRQTSERVLDGFVVEFRKINDCIDLYFQHYHQYLPILDPTFTPDQYHEYSPVLFWAMIVTGSRRYSDDPTLIETIGPRIRHMVLESLANIPQYFQLIQAILILCMWPIPLETLFKDPSLVLSGAAMQLALQHGLHLADTRRTFELDQLRSERDHEAARIKSMRRNDGRLWVYCKIACQQSVSRRLAVAILLTCKFSISICNGIDPYLPIDSHLYGSHTVSGAPSLQPIAKLQHLFVTAVAALSRHALLEDQRSPASIGSLVDVFDCQVRELAAEPEHELRE